MFYLSQDAYELAHECCREALRCGGRGWLARFKQNLVSYNAEGLFTDHETDELIRVFGLANH